MGLLSGSLLVSPWPVFDRRCREGCAPGAVNVRAASGLIVIPDLAVASLFGLPPWCIRSRLAGSSSSITSVGDAYVGRCDGLPGTTGTPALSGAGASEWRAGQPAVEHRDRRCVVSLCVALPSSVAQHDAEPATVPCFVRGGRMRGIPEEGSVPYIARSPSVKEWYRATASGTMTITLP